MQKEKTNNQNRSSFNGYIIIPNYFLKKWIRVIGIGPALLYQELLTYCHKEKYIAWPSLNSLSQQMGIAKTTLLRYQNTLIKFGLIKNITKNRDITGHNKNNVYKITPLKELPEDPNPDKIKDIPGSKMIPDNAHNECKFCTICPQNDTGNGSKMKPILVANCYPNNNHINNTNTTTREIVAVTVNSKKQKEKEEEKIKALKAIRSIREKLLQGKGEKL